MSPLSAMMKRRAPKWWSRGWPLDFQSKQHVVLPSGCGAQSMVSWVSNGSIQVDAPSVRDRRWCMPSRVSPNEAKLHLGPRSTAKCWCKCVVGWATWSKCIIIFVWLGYKQAMCDVEEAHGVAINALLWRRLMALNAHLTSAIMTSRGLGPRIGRPSPKWRPTCNPV